MSASQFDDILGEFGDSASTPAKISSVAASDEDFDPYGPSHGGEQSADLLDFSSDSEIKRRDTSNGIDSDFDATTSSYSAVMTTDAPSSGLLFDLDTETGANQPSGQHYEFSEEATTTSRTTNLLEDVDNDGTTGEAAEELNVPAGTSLGEPGDVDFLQADEPHNVRGDLLGGSDEEHGYEPEILNGHPMLVSEPHFVDEEEKYLVQVQDSGEEADVGTEEAAPYEAPADIEIPEVEPPAEIEVPAEVEAPEETSAEAEAQEETFAEVEAPEETSAEVEAPEETSAEAVAPPVETPASHPLVIPDVEVTETAEQAYSRLDEDERDEPSNITELRDGTGEGEAAGGVDEPELQSIQTADSHQEQLVADHFGHDRREKDLEHYCMDREESDLMDEQDASTEAHFDSLKPRDERSRSPSRSIGPDIPEERDRREPSPTPDTDTTDELDTLRPREDRSHAPSRSLEPEEKAKEEVTHEDNEASRTTDAGNRYSDYEPEQTQTAEDQSEFTSRIASESTSAQQKQADIQREAYHEKQSQQLLDDEEEEEGIYENQPSQRRDDVARETDTNRAADLPSTGTAQSMREKFLAAQKETRTAKREITPPIHGAGGEYVSEPRGYVEKYEGRAESGVFESQPAVNVDVINAGTSLEEAKYEAGHAKSTAAKFVELQSKSYTPSGKRELTPDRTGRVEYVSEPRGHFEKYEGKSESGVFESEPVVNPDVIRAGEEVKEELPERGTAKNIAEKFRQITSESTSPSAGSKGKREITPDRSGRVEYVSEPRGQRTEDYEAEEFVPERGYAKNVAAKFKELETNVKSPPSTPGRRKEFTPPREDERFHLAGVVENNPDFKTDVVHSGDQQEEALPERGTAKNIAERFRQLETESKIPVTSRPKREFTPPPGDAGVYENQPKQFQADYNRPPESGIIENQPLKRDDVIRGDEPPKYEEELPERGAAKNLVNRWKQLESESSKVKSPGSGRPKEFTPPREEPRIAEQRKSPCTPLSPSGNEQLDNGSVHPSDLPGQYQPQNEPSVFESTPQAQRSDVLKEGDNDWTEGMPKKNTAKKMLAKFQNIQAEASKQSPGPVSHKAKDVRNK